MTDPTPIVFSDPDYDGQLVPLERGYSVDRPGAADAPRPRDRAHLVVDWLLTRPEVDADAVVLFGRSFAGYLAPRAAAFEHRIAALVCDPAQPEMADRLPKGPAARLAAPVVRLQMRRNPRRREFFGARMATHGLTDVGAYFAELRRYSMLSLADRITCPTLVVEAEGDFAGGSGARLVEAMTAPTELVRLTAAQGADGHCGGHGQQVWAGAVYPWLHGVLARS
jgi:pimeloyl-ACP methyl ester carboxylesterase